QIGVPTNLATTAVVTVSSQNAATGQLGTKAVDGIVDGYPGDYSREWATTGQLNGAWINLAWSSGVTVSQVNLYDRPNLLDNILSGTLRFSDGSTVSVGTLPNNGAGLAVSFAPRSVSWLRFTINNAVGLNTGLAEIVVLNSGANGLSSVALNPVTVAGGASSTGTVVLNGLAPGGGAVIALSSNSSAAQVPPRVTVPGGQSNGNFTVTTSAVSSSTSANITASYLGSTANATLTVTLGTVSIAALSVNPGTEISGNNAVGTVTLTSAAPSGGGVITLSSDTSTSVVPANLTVGAGQSSATFTVTTTVPVAPVTATLTANSGSSSQTATLREEIGIGANLATTAVVTVSSQNAATGQLGTKAVDGIVDGYPGDYSREWATTGQLNGAWINLAWSSGVTVSQVILYDRPNLSDNILSGTLSFSDGSTVPVGTLPNNGAGLAVSFAPRSVSWLRFTINNAVGLNTGLAEIVVLNSGANGLSSVALNPVTVVGGASSTGTVVLNGLAPS